MGTLIDKIMADLIKGAEHNGKPIEVLQPGREEKLAAWSGAPALRGAYDAGTKAAFNRYKVAFLGPLLGMAANAAGSTLTGRMLGAGANRLGGQMLSNLGGQVAQSGMEHLMAPRQPMPIPFTR